MDKLNIIILLVLPFSLFATDLDLESTLQRAIDKNKNIKLAASDLKMADAMVKEAWAAALPNINVASSIDRNLKDSFFYINSTDSLGNEQTTKLDFTFKNQYQVNAVLNQTIFSFGKVSQALKVAYEFEDFSKLNYSSRKNAILTNVKKAFYRTILLKKVWQVAQEAEQSAKENYENIKIRFEGGVVSEFDLLQAEVRWQNTIPQTMEAHKNYELAVNNLKSLVDIPINEDITIVGDLDTYPDMPADIEEQDVFQLRPDYRALTLEKSMRNRNIKIQFANHLPSINGSVSYVYSGQSDRYKIENDNDNVVVGLSLAIPIYSGGYTSAQVQKARVEAEKTERRLQILEDDIRINLKNIELRMLETRGQIRASENNVKTARRAFEIAGSRVMNGLATQLELKDSRVLLDQAQVTYYQAIYEYLDAYFDWQFVTGKFNETGL